MLRPAQILRLVTINRVLIKHGLDEIVLATRLFRPVRWLYYLAPWNWWRRSRGVPRGERIRRALEDLGPIFVKFGQIISTRRDLLPEDVARELARLQDRVAPFSTREARRIIEAELGEPIDALYDDFDTEPLASASVAQVYGARLKSGERVIVKVIRPGIERVIERDLGLMRLIAELADKYSAEARRLRPREIVADYERTIMDELDLVREAANASQLKRNFEGSELLYIPGVYWGCTRERVMTMERIGGIPISDIDALKARGVNLKRLAERGVEIFFTQVFVHNFFHADMHPGNIFVDATDPERPRYVAVDFGIVGALSAEDRRYLAENFLAFFKQDYRRVAELHIDSGWVPAHVRVEDLESAIRTVCEPNFARPLKEISFGHVLVRLFQTVRRYDFNIQPQLVLLQKTLLNIEGLGRDLYPELDLWTSGKPFLEKALREQVAFQALLDRLPGRAPDWLRQLPDLPQQAADTLRQASRGELEVTLRSEALARLERRMAEHGRRGFFASLGAALVIAAAVIFGLDGFQPEVVYGVPVESWVLGLLGVLALGAGWPARRGD